MFKLQKSVSWLGAFPKGTQKLPVWKLKKFKKYGFKPPKGHRPMAIIDSCHQWPTTAANKKAVATTAFFGVVRGGVREPLELSNCSCSPRTDGHSTHRNHRQALLHRPPASRTCLHPALPLLCSSHLPSSRSLFVTAAALLLPQAWLPVVASSGLVLSFQSFYILWIAC